MKRHLRFAAFAAFALVCLMASAITAESPRSQSAKYNSADNVVTVTAKAPTYSEYDWETYLQEPLDHIDYVLIERHTPGTGWDNAEVARVTDVTPGATFSWTDTDVKSDMKYEYRLTCFIDGDRGSSSYANVYTGIVPGTLKDFTVTTPDWETKLFNISITAPDTDDNGNPLTVPVSVRVEMLNTMTWYEVGTFPDINPGETFTVQVEEGVQMNTTYNLRAYAFAGQAGNGYASEAQVFVGDDIPKAPESLTWEATSTELTLTWELPERGERGGCVNPDNVAYNIYMRYAGETDYTMLQERHVGERFTFPLDMPEETVLQFAVSARNTTGESYKKAETAQFTAGPYAAYPFRESFGGAEFEHHGWTATGYDDGYYQREVFGTFQSQTEYFLRDDINLLINPQDNDGGLLAAQFFGYMETGATYHITSPRIDFTNAKKPTVSLWYYYIPVTVEGTDHELRVLVSAEGGEYEEIIHSASIEKTDDHGWRQVIAPAPSLAGKTYGNVRIEVIHGPWSQDLSIDNIVVEDNDLSGIGSVEASDNASVPAEWYTLQGVRVAAPETTGIYIRRQGDSVEKVFVK